MLSCKQVFLNSVLLKLLFKCLYNTYLGFSFWVEWTVPILIGHLSWHSRCISLTQSFSRSSYIFPSPQHLGKGFPVIYDHTIFVLFIYVITPTVTYWMQSEIQIYLDLLYILADCEDAHGQTPFFYIIIYLKGGYLEEWKAAMIAICCVFDIVSSTNILVESSHLSESTNSR